MLCYRDRTFCPYYRECAKGSDCTAALTPEIEEAARRSGLLLASFLERPECFVAGDRRGEKKD